ncbi:hypothetical protein [Streptomyces gobiensis]|uniref:hypothetical protein n=1 Tax=Streptomyces gobiensis TaxID=2875706 RepID=UPI001E508E65|nr:hypothetical protein [Streptomyces gobiensis]UGY90913.1 hypothetical protein test1122_03695 [Streptomyces gobiensis]
MTEREHDRGDGREPLDEEAAWAQIVAAYGEEPPEPPGVWPKGGPEEPREPKKSRESRGSEEERTEPAETGADEADAKPEPEPDGDILTKPGAEREREPDGDEESAPEADKGDKPPHSLTVYAAGTGPRDWEPPEPPEDEDRFIPPEPPPLPQTDAVTKFAWLAVLGGPALLFGTVLFQQEMTWWITTLGIGGFLGGFGTLIARMRDDRDDDDFGDPGRGAVV